MKLKSILFSSTVIITFSCAPKVVPTFTEPKIEFKEIENTVAFNKNQYQGKTLFEANCAKCHKLYAPSDYSKEKWQPILKRMQANTDLTDAQTEQVYDYLTSGM